MLETKIVQKFGNSGHIVLPKEYIGRRIKFTTETKTFSQIKSEIISILEPYLEHILGVYLYGSYARNEQTLESDIDILVITDKKIKIQKENYEIISVTLKEIESTLESNAMLVLPIIKDAKPIINNTLLETLNNKQFEIKKSIKWFKESTVESIKSAKELIEVDKLEGEYISSYSIIYSLILRLRGTYLIKCLSSGKKFFNKDFKKWLLKKISDEDFNNMYKTYQKVRDKKKVKGIKIKIKSAICLLDFLKEEIEKIE